MNDTLEKELQDLIMQVCNVEEISGMEIRAEDPLIGPDSPMMLDSLDAVEIIVAVQHKYGIRIDSQKIARTILKSIRSLADFIRSQAGDDRVPSAAAS